MESVTIRYHLYDGQVMNHNQVKQHYRELERKSHPDTFILPDLANISFKLCTLVLVSIKTLMELSSYFNNY